MAKGSAVKVRICESCEEQDAVKKVEDLGWVCADCLHSYKHMDDDETQMGELDDDEIDHLASMDGEGFDLDEDDEGSLTASELKRQGFLLDENDEDDYN
jgi:hypothetical protein